MNRDKLYILVMIATTAGLLWSGMHLIYPDKMLSIPVCIFKAVTGIPCPSCGSTHSVLCLLRLDIKGAINENPIGLLLAPLMVMLPVWVAYDVVNNKNSLHTFYLKAERFVRRPAVAVCLIASIAADWIWNIHKYL